LSHDEIKKLNNLYMRVQKGLSYTCHLMSHKKEDIELACPKLKYTEGRKFVWGYVYNKPFQE